MEQKISELDKAVELAKKSFMQDLRNLEEKEQDVYVEYHRLLWNAQLGSAKANGGKPIHLSIDQRRDFINQARINLHPKSVDINNMEEKYQKYSASNGRPPIGGAQDD